MEVLIYDGSFEGFLSTVYECYYKKYYPLEILRREPAIRNFIYSYQKIATSEQKSQKVYDAIKIKLGSDFLKKCYMAHLAEIQTENVKIYEFIRMGFSQGRIITEDLTHPIVMTVEDLRKKVTREQHRLLGLTRFSILDDETLFSVIEPKYDVLSLIAPHFSERLLTERWVIYDKKRKTAVFGQDENWIRKEITGDPEVVFHSQEEEYRKLWRAFHRSLAIEERRNPKLQKQLMPKYYWKYLTEKSSPPEDGENTALQ